jgi:GH25 family lysozyme M1 (1,4-beta-N-acetylmuramidase)
MNAIGIDGSYWQGLNIDWKKVRGSGISFVFLRATSGIKKDSSYSANYSGAGDAGILRGSYHYFYPQYDIVQQARLFATTILDEELPPVLDVEQDGLTEWKFWQFTNKGRVDGYYGNIDMNYFNGDENVLYAYVGDTTPPPPPLSLEQREADLEKGVKRLEDIFYP